TFMDIPSSAQAFAYFAENLEEFLREEKREVTAEAQCKLLREPLGVAALIVPWNFPLLLASWKLAAALAAGNSVILKPSSQTPLTVLALAKIIQAAGLPKGVVNIINASGAKLGKALCADKRLDLISFTGSGEAGRKIIAYSSRNVKKLIMELGGKSAAIVLKDADLEVAVNGLLCSIFLNQGQMCTAMSRIFVDAAVYDKFIAAFVEKAKRIKIGSGMDYETQMGSLISQPQRQRVLAYVEKGRQEGAKLLCGGKIPADPKLSKGFFFELTVFSEVSSRMAISREEIFGPVACMMKFSDLEAAVREVNNTDFALAASIWTKEPAAAEALAKKIDAGVVWVNTYGMFYPQTPFGGFKQSGFGKELGREGFWEYTRLKNLITDQSKDARPLVNYWYGF
ncbi:MAG: aldehyde dehydrogenase family protein, partial [Candidatus Omnitrophota bacterium]|nr:aldehyde dehydrogenase family protein [Candidatus Omnitrophota bacterium]